MRAVLLLLPVLALGAASCGDDDEPDTVADGGSEGADDADGDGAGEGTIAVRLEQIEGVMIEGFELGLRFTDAASGEELDRVVWNEFVAEQGNPDIDAFYDSVYELTVPAGTVRIGSDVNVGIGPAPEPADLDATPMPCELDVEVAADETVEVEVSFDDASDTCLQVVT